MSRRPFKKALVAPFRYFVDRDQRLDKRTRKKHAALAMRAYYARLEHSAVTDGGADDQRSP